MNSEPGDKSFATQIDQLFELSAVKLLDTSSFFTGISGQSQIHDLPIKVRIAPLRKSRYQGRRRVGASTLGYRQTLEISPGVAVKFSVVHQGISGSTLIKWVNRWKGIYRVPHVVTDLYRCDVWCSNPDWATRLLDDTDANVAITRLMAVTEKDAVLGHPCVFMTAKLVSHNRRGKNLQSFAKLREDLENLAVLTRVAHGLGLS